MTYYPNTRDYSLYVEIYHNPSGNLWTRFWMNTFWQGDATGYTITVYVPSIGASTNGVNTYSYNNISYSYGVNNSSGRSVSRVDAVFPKVEGDVRNDITAWNKAMAAITPYFTSWAKSVYKCCWYIDREPLNIKIGMARKAS